MFTKILLLVALLFPAAGALAIGEYDENILARSDTSNDTSVDMGEAVYINTYLFQGGPASKADSSDDGVLDDPDGVLILRCFFNKRVEPR